jgi:hypothetical protein
MRDLDIILRFMYWPLYNRENNSLYLLFRKVECDPEPDLVMVEIQEFCLYQELYLVVQPQVICFICLTTRLATLAMFGYIGHFFLYSDLRRPNEDIHIAY